MPIITLLSLMGCPQPDPGPGTTTTDPGPPCDTVEDCCHVAPDALCSLDGFCESNPFCAADPQCLGSRGGACGPVDDDDEPGQGDGECATLDRLRWSGQTPCFAINGYEQSVIDEVFSLWAIGPSVICSYDGAAPLQGPCGPLTAGNALYCGADDSIAWDARFMNDQFNRHGDFAPITIIAHEWGHQNQAHLGMLTGPSNKALELHADCQAGIFAAVQESRGNLGVGDVCEAFSSLCESGDPYYSPWFQPGMHGTCTERTGAFEAGYQGALDKLDALCEGDPIEAMREICG